ncbi:hypothetical protein [Diadegma fenestrale ichnovirus]|uniref:Uncharacterized protein n=1 Tax=Diadegma fenestrale ichnovirus TaxID=1428464 RepID=A0A075VSY8_9VIRU|nr:hypothetical protein B2.1 [Diadegma fenestrale ichnovirus]ULM71585.1 hypothetical protein [Diadegma fenestrale ichnovirus]
MNEGNQSTTPEWSTSTDSRNASSSDTEQNDDGDYGTSTLESEDRSWSYGESSSSGGMPEANQSTTTELSTSTDLGNLPDSDIKQNAAGDFGTSTVGSGDRWLGYEDSASSEHVSQFNRTATTESSTRSDAGNVGLLFILCIVILVCFICLCIVTLILIRVLKKKEKQLSINNDIEMVSPPAPRVWQK